MIDCWEQHNTLPLQGEIAHAARCLVQGEQLPHQQAKTLFEHLRPYRGWYNAAGLVYFAANEEDRGVETFYKNLMEYWKRPNTRQEFR